MGDSLTKQKEVTDKEIQELKNKIVEVKAAVLQQKTEARVAKQQAEFLLQQERVEQERMAVTFKEKLAENAAKLIEFERSHVTLEAKNQELIRQMVTNEQQYQTDLTMKADAKEAFTVEKDQALKLAKEAEKFTQAAVVKIAQLNHEIVAFTEVRRKDVERSTESLARLSRISLLLATRKDVGNDGNKTIGTKYVRHIHKPR